MREKANYKNLTTKRQWRANTGLDEAQFYNLSKEFEISYTELLGKTMEELHANTTTDCAFRNTEELLYFLLFSMKTGLTQDALGFVYGIDGSNVHKNRKVAARILQAVLTKSGAMPKRSFATEKEFNEYFEAHKELILDGTEQPIQRPGDQDNQKDMYSGKKNAIQ